MQQPTNKQVQIQFIYSNNLVQEGQIYRINKTTNHRLDGYIHIVIQEKYSKNERMKESIFNLFM